MAVYEYDETQQIIDHGHLGRIASAKFEAQAFLDMHANDYLPTRQNGEALSRYLQENNLELTAENFEVAFKKLKSTGELLPPRETIAKMSADELKKFAAEHGEPVYDGHGRVMGHNFPEAYNAPATDYNRPAQGRQSSTLTPALDPYPEDANKSFTKKQIAGFSAARFRAYHERMGTWGR